MQDKQNAWSLEQWNRTNEYNSPVEQVKRIREAGLNPMYYGLDGSSASSFESAQALGYDRASTSGMSNPIQAGLDAMIQNQQSALLKSQIEKTEAEKNKIEADTDSTKLDNEFNERTMEARVEGQKLANSLTKAQLAEISDNRKLIAENIKKVAAETENEQERKYLIQAETNVRKMEAKQIAELLPLQKLLVEAQTKAQKASASLAFMQAAIQQGLLESGYVDRQIELLDGQIRASGLAADNAEQVKQLNEFKAAIRSGRYSEWMLGDDATWLQKQTGRLFDGIYSTMSALSESIAGPLGGLIK